MKSFDLMVEMCQSLSEKPGMTIDYQARDFSIKLTSAPVRAAATPPPAGTGAEEKRLFHPPAGVKILSENIGYFVRTTRTSALPVVDKGDAVSKGQMIGLCLVGDFCIPLRSPVSGVLEGYLVAEGELIEYGSEIACITEELPA
ncbi:hypothetical protein B5M10_05870 [Pluralibacter gergoviae]|uniref:hypothetical protein n=1 Tax=Pluralibacter gergoviae TaxID=61647 RepID=UPI0005EC4037|nr:hypothetical protein [Pluralibacter gergoviae]KJM65497.1 hypothetical protein SS31_06430 [Pluralibacter gergoviae]OUR03812.1 hypothetical protein B5M10_05870 [Pluralibacter gergoviae]